MAIVSAPLALNVIRTFRGSLDFYYWKRLAVCRRWPRRAQQPNSAKQLQARANFSRMIHILQTLPKEWHDLWTQVKLPHGRSITDLKRKHVLWLLHTNQWSEPPIPIDAVYQHQDAAPYAIVYITHRPMTTPTDALKTVWLYRETDNEGDRFSYTDTNALRTREHYYYHATQPNMGDYHLPLVTRYDATRLMWSLTITPTTRPLSICARPTMAP